MLPALLYHIHIGTAERACVQGAVVGAGILSQSVARDLVSLGVSLVPRFILFFPQ
jgi:hypothetical protein